MKLSSILRNSIHFYELANSNYFINKYAQQDEIISSLNKAIDTTYDLDDTSLYESLVFLKTAYEYVLRQKSGFAILNQLIYLADKHLSNYISTPNENLEDEYDREEDDEDDEDEDDDEGEDDNEQQAYKNKSEIENSDNFNIKDLRTTLYFIDFKNRQFTNNDPNKLDFNQVSNSEKNNFNNLALTALSNDKIQRANQSKDFDEYTDEEQDTSEQIAEDFEESGGSKIDKKDLKNNLSLANRASKNNYELNKRYFESLLALNYPASIRKNISNALKQNEKLNLLMEEEKEIKSNINKLTYEDLLKNMSSAGINKETYKIEAEKFAKRMKNDPKNLDLIKKLKDLQYNIGTTRFAIWDEKVKINNFKNLQLIQDQIKNIQDIDIKIKDLNIAKVKLQNMEKSEKTDQLIQDIDTEIEYLLFDKIVLNQEKELLELRKNLNRGKWVEISIREKFLHRLKNEDLTEEDWKKYYFDIEQAKKLQHSTSTTSHKKRLEDKKSDDPFIRIYAELAQNITGTKAGDRKDKVMAEWFRIILLYASSVKLINHDIKGVTGLGKVKIKKNEKPESAPKEINEFRSNLLKIAQTIEENKKIQTEIKQLTTKNDELLKVLNEKKDTLDKQMKNEIKALRDRLKYSIGDFKQWAEKLVAVTEAHDKEFKDAKELEKLMESACDNYIRRYSELDIIQLGLLHDELKKIIDLSSNIIKDLHLRRGSKNIIKEVYNISKEYKEKVSFTIKERGGSINEDESYNFKQSNINIRKKLLLKLSSINKNAFEDTDLKFKDIQVSNIDISNISKESLEEADQIFDNLLNEVTIEVMQYIDQLFSDD